MILRKTHIYDGSADIRRSARTADQRASVAPEGICTRSVRKKNICYIYS